MERHRERSPQRAEHGAQTDPMISELEACGVRIEKMPSTPQHPTVDLSGIAVPDRSRTALAQKQVSDFAEMCERFRAGSMVTDRFENHVERRHFRHEMDAKYGRAFHDIMERNMLKLNNLASIYSYMEFVVSSLDGAGVTSQKAERIRALAKEMPDLSRYEEYLQDERVATVREMVRLCERYLAIIAAPDSQR